MIASPSLELARCIERCVHGVDLSVAEAEEVTGLIADGRATPAQTAALLVALAVKGECAAELAGAARALRKRSLALECRHRPLLDVCGTGGDGAGSFNVSTTVAFVAAGAGATVAKHGNRAMSSACGSADVVEALGAPIELPPHLLTSLLEDFGIGFLFAQRYHPSLRNVAGVRREIAVRTLFNLVGPLVNPARPERQLVGVPHRRFLRPVVEALAAGGCERCAAVCGEDGIDEVSISAPTCVAEWTGRDIIEYVVSPQTFGVAISSRAGILGGDAANNAVVIRRVLDGEPGAPRDVVVINAAVALVIAGIAADFKEGAERARISIDSGAAKSKLEALANGGRV
jgi:anthranilate phosphoribosyltransferase